VPAQQFIGQILATFKELPPSQRPGSEGIGIGADTRFTGTINKILLEVRK
jgi:hypothetical protein